MSTTTSRPVTGRLLDLPGQTHVAEGPLDLNGMYLAHHAFRRDLTRFAAAARHTPLEDVAVWQALGVRWEQFSGVLHHHHTTEDDVLWPQLMDQADAEGRATLEAMEAEHELIDPLLAGCAAGFAAMAQSPDAATRDRLVATAETARDTLSEHMRHEECEALPLVQELLPTEGWERVEKAAGSGKSLKDLMFLAPWLADGLSPEQLETAVAMIGAPFRVLLAMTRGRYARREMVAFRYSKDLPAPRPSRARAGTLPGGRV